MRGHQWQISGQKWKEKVIMFPTCATDEGNVKYRQILLHSGMIGELRKKLMAQGLTADDIDAHDCSCACSLLGH